MAQQARFTVRHSIDATSHTDLAAPLPAFVDPEVGLEAFVLRLYGHTPGTYQTLAEARGAKVAAVYGSGKKDASPDKTLRSIPPTVSEVESHALRCHHQLLVWRAAMTPTGLINAVEPSPEELGWNLVEGAWVALASTAQADSDAAQRMAAAERDAQEVAEPTLRRTTIEEEEEEEAAYDAAELAFSLTREIGGRPG
jgi:hypothetical protein